MVLDVDRFEDFADEVIRTPHKRKSKPTDGKVKENIKEETPDQKVDKYLNRLKLLWSNLPQEEQENKLNSYYSWVKSSLALNEPIFEENQLLIKNERKMTKVTHIPTEMFGLDIGLEDERMRIINAKDKAYLRVDRHFKDWTRTSPEFKQKHLNSDRTL